MDLDFESVDATFLFDTFLLLLIGIGPKLALVPFLDMTAGMPIATGAALAAKLAKSDGVAVAFFGDGASNEGAFHSSLNLAAIWKLPAIFVCENNGYSQSTPVEYALPISNVAERAAAYRMPGVTVDGQDVFPVWQAAEAAVARARDGAGPSLIECKTYRYYGHHQGDDTRRYRTREEEDAARQVEKVVREEKHRSERQQLEFEKTLRQREEDFEHRLKQREQELSLACGPPA